MKLMDGIKILQKKYPKHIILVKNGVFYNAIGKDAIILSKEFKLKKICFSKNVCKIGINENKIKKFIETLKQNNYKYIIYNYHKGEFKDIDEQFIETERKDNGKEIKKEEYKVECKNCEYHKRIERRAKIIISSNENSKKSNNEKLKKIYENKKELENYILYIRKITQDYINKLIDMYLMEDNNE